MDKYLIQSHFKKRKRNIPNISYFYDEHSLTHMATTVNLIPKPALSSPGKLSMLWNCSNYSENMKILQKHCTSFCLLLFSNWFLQWQHFLALKCAGFKRQYSSNMWKVENMQNRQYHRKLTWFAGCYKKHSTGSISGVSHMTCWWFVLSSLCALHPAHRIKDQRRFDRKTLMNYLSCKIRQTFLHVIHTPLRSVIWTGIQP